MKNNQTMSKLRPVEEVAQEHSQEAYLFYLSEHCVSVKQVEELLITDRHAIHTLLREGVEKLLVDENFNVHWKFGYLKAQDDILTQIDELFSDKTETNVSHK